MSTSTSTDRSPWSRPGRWRRCRRSRLRWSGSDDVVDGAVVLTVPSWLASAGRISRPSWRQPAPRMRERESARGKATRRRTMVEPTRRPHSIAFRSVKERLCLLTVHAHPDDEASKGAPTMAMYNAQGVHTVLVCCTGGEEGDLQNPALREPGQPFHGLTAEEEKQRLAELRPSELARSAEIIGFDEVVMLGYRDSGMVDTDPNQHPESFHQAPIDEAVGRAGRRHPRAARRRHHHLRRRSARLPASRPPEGARHLGAGVRACRRPGVVPRAGRAVPAAEAVLHGVGQGPTDRNPRGA